MPHATVANNMLALQKPPARPGAQQIQQYVHPLKNVLLALLSLFFLPLDTALLFFSYALRIIRRDESTRRRRRSSPGFRPRTVLVTGLGMAKGLCLARMFYEAGHDVIGADFEPDGVPVCGRASRALKKFYRLSLPDPKTGAARYIQDLLNLVCRENVDLWVSCSGVASALEEAQAKEIVEHRTSCRAIQFDLNLIETLHAKDAFIAYTAKIGLKVPETHLVATRDAVHKILNNAATGRQFIIKNVGMDDASRADLTVLPRPTVSETYQYISNLDISSRNPWVLQRFIRGKEYCTHSLVIDGDVKAFVACPSAELLMHYEPLPSDSALNLAMTYFTQQFAHQTGPRTTGHLSFDFMVEERANAEGVESVIYPIECNPRTHTAVILFNDKKTRLAMVDSYLSSLNSVDDHHVMTTNGYAHDHELVSVDRPAKFYWAGHDLVTLFFIPLFQFIITRNISFQFFLRRIAILLDHLLFWTDGTYSSWDPLPVWWLYHVYWPGKFLIAVINGKRWSRVNVSTTKMFAC